MQLLYNKCSIPHHYKNVNVNVNGINSPPIITFCLTEEYVEGKNRIWKRVVNVALLLNLTLKATLRPSHGDKNIQQRVFASGHPPNY
jgi:hypothetical protein